MESGLGLLIAGLAAAIVWIVEITSAENDRKKAEDALNESYDTQNKKLEYQIALRKQLGLSGIFSDCGFILISDFDLSELGICDLNCNNLQPF